MKKRIVLSTLIAGFSYVVFSSHSGGLAYVGGLDRTGAQATPTTCGSVAAGCHNGTGAATSVTITVDSGSTPVTHYVPGDTYTILIHGTNTAANPKFGFQFTSVSGTGASQVQAGTATYLPASVAITPLSGLSIVEQSASITAATAGVYNVSFMWTAPTAGVGNITLYCTLNAVNGDELADVQDVSNNISVILGQEAKPNSVASVIDPVTIRAFPNPVSNSLNLQFENAISGTYLFSAYDLTGKCISNENINVTGASQNITVNTTYWMPGIYQLCIEKDGNRKVIPVVKN